MHNPLDTFQNIIVFAFIGAMIWLYFKKEPADRVEEDRTKNKQKEDSTLH